MSFETAFTIVMTILVLAAPVAMVLILVVSAPRLAYSAAPSTAQDAPEPDWTPDYADAPLAA